MGGRVCTIRLGVCGGSGLGPLGKRCRDGIRQGLGVAAVGGRWVFAVMAANRVVGSRRHL